MIEIGGIPLPIHVSATLKQSLSPLWGAFEQRMESGHLRRQVHWANRKWSVTLNGVGTLSTGIHELDYRNPVTVKLTNALEILSPTNIITLPSNRRSDTGYQPTGWAKISPKTWQSTPASLDGDVLTLTPVPGAVQYRAIYYPELSVYSDGPQEERSHNSGLVTWTFEGEEI